MSDGSATKKLVEAIYTVLRQWVEVRHREPTYFITQLITEHDCFSRYLWEEVGIEPDRGCHNCASGAVDTAEHTLVVCTGRDAQRTTLVEAVGRDLSLQAIVQSMACREQNQATVTSFAREVMAAKSDARWKRERAGETLAPCRATAKGRRRTRPRAVGRGICCAQCEGCPPPPMLLKGAS